ncbi:MAG: FAD-dependent oxidoreductase [Verrucomicrobia bacterium]|nr:FAD-dependent oxidoreductase [Verrucomicrobiota bacterium]
MRCDVLVAGGGSAGLAAGIAAARTGAHTVLLERHGSLGGMATAALIHSFCGLYLLRSEPGAVLANPGFPSEFALRLSKAGGTHGPIRMGRVDVLLQHPTAFARLADALVQETPNLEVRFHTELIGVQATTRVDSLETCCRGVREIIQPKVVIDATGDAALASLAGADCEQEESQKLQRPAFIFALQGVREETLADAGRLRIAHEIATAVRAGRLPRGAMGAALRGSGRNGEAFVTVDLNGPPGLEYNPTNPKCLSGLEAHGRELAGALAEFLKSEVEGFAESYIAALPARVGIRESRRMIGEYRIEDADILNGARFPDAVALATWPMEMREQATGARLRFPENNQPCEIPLRALRSKRVHNLFAAGRCISSSHGAQGSIRVIGTCFATGEAAGIAAALMSHQASDWVDAAEVTASRDRIMIPFAQRYTTL